MGVSGPELIKKKLIVEIQPWFSSEFRLLVQFYVVHGLDKQIEVSKEQISHLLLANEKFDVPAPISALLGAGVYADIIAAGLYKHIDGAMMQETQLGHIILGKFLVKKNSSYSAVMNLTQAPQCIEPYQFENKNYNESLKNALS